MPQQGLQNKFPPKFSENIRYPAIQNLDQLPMPDSDFSSGTYFSTQFFPAYDLDATPFLTYGKHKFNIEQINARFCRKCHRGIANNTKKYNKDCGLFGNPFWTSMRKKNGKDWKEIFTKNLGNRR